MIRKFLQLSIAVIIGSSSSCSYYPNYQDVLEVPKEQAMVHCKLLGEVYGEHPILRYAQHKARYKAKIISATHIVWKAIDPGLFSGVIVARAYRC